MKIYKLDINTSKPTNQIVQMQQNATGALSVVVSNDGKYIRNLSCALYEGETELSAYATTDVGAGYKIDMGNETKVVKFMAKSTPIECSAQYWVGGSGRRVNIFAERVQLPAGTYNQDEFQNLVYQFASQNNGLITIFLPKQTSISSVNFSRICLIPSNSQQQIWFRNSADTEWLNSNEQIVATDDAIIGVNTMKYLNGATLSVVTYPAVGYWTDYSLNTTVMPTTNAHCYAECDIAQPTTNEGE